MRYDSLRGLCHFAIRFVFLWDEIMLRKRYVIECINGTLKNTESLVHSRHRSISNFIRNLVPALGAYCFYDNKPRTLSGFKVVTTNQLSLFYALLSM